MDTPHFRTLRIAPTTQQGGTQTIQQSIYLTHNNPCGANLLIFQEMGLTGIRYIDLKNFLDEILKSDEMIALFEEVRARGTDYINDPNDNQHTYAYLYAIQQWAQASYNNLPLPERYYSGYRFRLNVYDASGTVLYDSYYKSIKIIKYNTAANYYDLEQARVLPSNPYYNIKQTAVYKISTNYSQIPFIDILPPSGFISGFSIILSNFSTNQGGLPETTMATASLLVDSANTRAFGIPKYGFSARSSLSGFGGITYNCVQYIDIRTTPDPEGQTTLIESIFFRLSLEEDTFNFAITDQEENMDAQFKQDFIVSYMERNPIAMENLVNMFLEKQMEQTESVNKNEEDN